MNKRYLAIQKNAMAMIGALSKIIVVPGGIRARRLLLYARRTFRYADARATHAPQGTCLIAPAEVLLGSLAGLGKVVLGMDSILSLGH
jgi:hypothetical protein